MVKVAKPAFKQLFQLRVKKAMHVVEEVGLLWVRFYFGVDLIKYL